jgi:hypothetical protein
MGRYVGVDVSPKALEALKGSMQTLLCDVPAATGTSPHVTILSGSLADVCSSPECNGCDAVVMVETGKPLTLNPKPCYKKLKSKNPKRN